MAEYQVRSGDPADAAEVFAVVGFRPDLVDDLELVLRLGGTIFAATLNHEVVGVSSCLPFSTTGWVGGVAVLPGHSRRGLGERLTARAVAALRERGARTVLLHATAAARPLYERMGFVAEVEFVELAGPSLETFVVPSAPLRPATVDDLGCVLALDRAATGEDRSSLLRALWPTGAHVYDDGQIVGYHLPQSATAAGAVVASGSEAGLALLITALAGRRGSIRVPSPVDHPQVSGLLGAAGYSVHVRTTRMRLGTPVDVDLGRLFSAFNLYWG